jgi:RNA polymerase-binding transcription factor DksA
MTQEEIIKLAHTAGFNWPDIQATTIEQRLERFASLVAATEREKFTNTQEFVTLPREVVEQALEALEEADLLMEHRQNIELRRSALVALRAALEQPQESPYGECDECGTEYSFDPTDGGSICVACLKERLEQSQGEQAPVAWLWVNKQTGAKGVCFEIPTAFHPDYLWRHLYTHPQPAQKPLTDDQVLKAVRHLYQSDLPVGMGFSDDLDVARAIEAAHNIK